MTETSGVILSGQGLCKTYSAKKREVVAVQEVSLAIRTGEVVALHGPSGCGKSTLLLMAGALLSPDHGTVRIGGADPYAMSRSGRSGFRRRHLGFVFQDFNLLPYLGLLDNILAPTLAQGGVNGHSERARELLEQFGLADRLRHKPSELSIGERQRVALARAFLLRPELILADEPTGNLDPANVAIVLEQFRAYAADGAGVLVVTHSERVLEEADRVIRMTAGRIEQD